MDDGTINSGFPILQWQQPATPPVTLLAPTNMAFSNITSSSLDISWTDNSTGEAGYVVENSLDGTNYTIVADLPANTETTPITGLSSGLNYFKVYAVSAVPVSGPEVIGTVTLVVATNEITAVKYPFTQGVGTYPVGGSTILIQSGQDNVSSGTRSLGFTFWYAGQAYTQYSVTDNGLLTLGGTSLTGSETSNSMAAATPGIKIAPYWDDLSTGTNGNVNSWYYSGTLYITWNVTVPKNTTGPANAVFQVRISSAGSIGFFYGTTHATVPANAGGYSIGIGNSSPDFASLTVTSPTTFTGAYRTANDANTLSIGGGKYIQFSPDHTAPTISAGTIPITPGTGNRTITKTIADAGTGVPTTGDYTPRIYYKKNTGGSWVSTPGVLTSGYSASGTWDFTVDHSLVGGVVQGDQIYYYFIAQDQSTTFGVPNIKFYPTNTGVAASDVNTVTVPPTTPYMYYIPLDLTGTKTVGTGGDFASLTNAGGLFDQLNQGTLNGNLTVNIISDLPGETGTIHVQCLG